MGKQVHTPPIGELVCFGKVGFKRYKKMMELFKKKARSAKPKSELTTMGVKKFQAHNLLNPGIKEQQERQSKDRD